MHTIFPGEITVEWLNGEIHPLLWLPCTNIFIAASEFTDTESSLPGQEPHPGIFSKPGLPMGQHVCVHNGDCKEAAVSARPCLLAACCPSTLFCPILNCPHHCVLRGETVLSVVQVNPYLKLLQTSRWSLPYTKRQQGSLSTLPQTALIHPPPCAKGTCCVQEFLLHLFFLCPFHIPTLFCMQHGKTKRFL